jgi:hypothetical protein
MFGRFGCVLSLGAVVAALTCPVVHADAIDDTFLAALRSKGINYGTPVTALTAAHEVCDELDIGRSTQEVANEVIHNSNLDGYHAGYFVGAAVRAYCPGHRL